MIKHKATKNKSYGTTVLRNGGETIMFYAGIDIAKFKHDFCIFDGDTGELIVPPTTISNDKEGFQVLLDALNHLVCSQKIKIGLEATGHYGSNLKTFLSKSGYKFIELNPLQVSRFHSQVSLRRSKTDKIDCQVIAKYLMATATKTYQPQVYHLEALKSLTRLRESFVKQRSQALVRLTNILDITFPEFKKFFTAKLRSETAMFILRKYKTPIRIAKWTDEDVQLVHNKSRKLSTSKLLDLKQAAIDTIGNSPKYLIDELPIILNVYESLDEEVSKLEKRIVSIMEEIDSPTASIPGIGLISAATIIGEFGDFSKYPSAEQCIAYAGLDVGISQSGTKCFKGKMVKRGSSHLRYTLINVAQTVSIHCPTFKTYWVRKKVQRNKFLRVADSHVAKKLVRVIYYLETHNVKYDESRCK